MIREALENFQVTPNLTENINARDFASETDCAHPGSKPFAPWAIGISTLAVVLLMLGIRQPPTYRVSKNLIVSMRLRR